MNSLEPRDPGVEGMVDKAKGELRSKRHYFNNIIYSSRDKIYTLKALRAI